MFVVAWSAPVHAQLTGGCSEAEQKRIATYNQLAVQALMEGNGDRFIGLQREMDSMLSKVCLATLDRQYPARVRCSVHERKVVLNFTSR